MSYYTLLFRTISRCIMFDCITTSVKRQRLPCPRPKNATSPKKNTRSIDKLCSTSAVNASLGSRACVKPTSRFQFKALLVHDSSGVGVSKQWYKL